MTEDLNYSFKRNQVTNTMGGSRVIPSIAQQHREVSEQIFPEDTYIRGQRHLYPNMKTQGHMIQYWKIQSDYLDTIIPNHKLTKTMCKLQAILREAYCEMLAKNSVSRHIPLLIMKSLEVQRDFLKNATRLSSILTRAQHAYINHLSAFGDSNRNVDSAWEFYETTTLSSHLNWEDFSHILTDILYAKGFLRALLVNISECYESSLHIIASCRDVLTSMDHFVETHHPDSQPRV